MSQRTQTTESDSDLAPLVAHFYEEAPVAVRRRLLKAMLVIALFSVRSEEQFCEQLRYNMLFRWFLDMDINEEPFVPTTFTHNRQRLLEHRRQGRPAQLGRHRARRIPGRAARLPGRRQRGERRDRDAGRFRGRSTT